MHHHIVHAPPAAVERRCRHCNRIDDGHPRISCEVNNAVDRALEADKAANHRADRLIERIVTHRATMERALTALRKGDIAEAQRELEQRLIEGGAAA